MAASIGHSAYDAKAGQDRGSSSGWRCYWSHGRTDDSLEHPHPRPGQRAFGIVFARRMARGEAHTTWSEWSNITPCTELASHGPADFRALVEKRIAIRPMFRTSFRCR